ncbi:MAG: tol-pal system-associated acyl-CoA thioesterase [Gammaproteobacteria bacterium]|nr:tol-pal system-associated acyl-CoA thioesterase [Gammaproteobacteria bacterium]
MVNEFIWPIRVYYEDTDSGGVVYHANYLKFMERARTEWLRTLGLEQDEIVEQLGIYFVVHSLSINYIKPALFNEALWVKSTIKKLSKARIIYKQQLIRKDEHNGEEQVLSDGEVTIVGISQSLEKPIRLPQEIYELFL